MLVAEVEVVVLLFVVTVLLLVAEDVAVKVVVVDLVDLDSKVMRQFMK